MLYEYVHCIFFYRDQFIKVQHILKTSVHQQQRYRVSN